jgi:hypothetical protein
MAMSLWRPFLEIKKIKPATMGADVRAISPSHTGMLIASPSTRLVGRKKFWSSENTE